MRTFKKFRELDDFVLGDALGPVCVRIQLNYDIVYLLWVGDVNPETGSATFLRIKKS